MAQDDKGRGARRGRVGRGIDSILTKAKNRGADETRRRISDMEGEAGHERISVEPVRGRESYIDEDSPLVQLDGVSTHVPEGADVVDAAGDAQADARADEARTDVEDVESWGPERVVERPMGANPDEGMYDYLTDTYETEEPTADGGTQRIPHVSRNRADRVRAARDLFGSTQDAASMEENEQLRRMRNSIDRCDRSSFERFKNMHLGAANRQEKRERIRQAQINRRQTYRQLAIGCLFQGESMFQGLVSAAGLTFGYLISGGLGKHVSRRTGLTRAESFTKRLDGIVDFFERNRHTDEAIIDGSGSRKRDFLLDRVLIPARDRMHWLTGKPIPESASTLATYQLGIMSRALEDMSQPGADVMSIRKNAFDDIKAIYEIAHADGINSRQLDVERERIGRCLDRSADPRNHLSIRFGDESYVVSSRGLRRAFGSFMDGEVDMDNLLRLLTRNAPGSRDDLSESVDASDADAAEPRDAERGSDEATDDGADVTYESGSDEVTDDGADVAYENGHLREEVADEDLRRVKVSSARVAPAFNENVNVIDNVADVMRELRERGSFGDALVYPGGISFSPKDLPALANAYQFASDTSLPDSYLVGQESFAHSLRRAREMLVMFHASDGVDDLTLQLGLERDFCACANEMYGGGFDICDPWGEAKRSFEAIDAYLADAKDVDFHEYRDAAEDVGAFMVDLLEHSEGKPYRFGHIGDVQREDGRAPNVLDDLADKLRFSFACEPYARYAFASAMYRHIVRPQSEVFTNDLLDRCGEYRLSYFDLDDRAYEGGKSSPLALLDGLGDTFDPTLLDLDNDDAFRELRQEMYMVGAFSPLSNAPADTAFGPLVDCCKRLQNEFEGEPAASVLARFRERMFEHDEAVMRQALSVVAMGGPSHEEASREASSGRGQATPDNVVDRVIVDETDGPFDGAKPEQQVAKSADGTEVLRTVGDAPGEAGLELGDRMPIADADLADEDGGLDDRQP